MNIIYKAKRNHMGSLIPVLIPCYLKTIVLPVIVLFAAVFNTVQVNAQNIILQDVVMGKAVVSSPTSVIMDPGFHAVEGSAFRAFIGPVQGINPTFPVASPPVAAVPSPGSTASNYVKTITYREAKTSVPATAFKHLEEISYFDGLGRSIQNVGVGAAPAGEDIIQPVLYDVYGREAIKTLPYTDAKSGEFRSGVTEATINNYYNTDGKVPDGIEKNNRAFTQIAFDNSPLNRVVSQTGPGEAWAGKPVTIDYLTNATGDNVTGWNVDASGNFTPFTYVASTLFVTQTTDEQGNVSREYKDKQGKVVQKSVKLDGNWLRTAYIYDDFGLLRCVVPPKASGTDDVALCYYYKYDGRKRMIEKKIPGGGTFTMVYDERNRLRCSQDSKQLSTNEWTYIKYDALNRPVITGTVIKTGDMKAAVDAAPLNETRNNVAATFGYTSVSYPLSGGTVLSVTFYDDYTFISGMGLNDSLKSVTFDAGSYILNGKIDALPIGQVTGTMTRVLSPADAYTVPDALLYSTNHFDKYGHLLRTISENHLKGKDVVSNVYEDITYLVTKSKQQHFKGTEPLSIEHTFAYDHTGRLLSTIQQVNGQNPVTLNDMKYNKVGQLVTKHLHSPQTSGTRTFTQKVDYRYNIRGWLTRINDPALTGENDLFGMQLCYENTGALGTLGTSGTVYFNGNISGMKWNIKNDASRGYVFTYDGLNRLKTTNYAEGSSLNTKTGYFTESVTSYDNNGNILGLQRKYDNILVDNLFYSYTANTNQVLKITDTGTANANIDDYPATSNNYAYDAVGNMTTDGSRNATLSYHKTINLPSSVDFGSNNRIYYHYTAGGAKLIKHVSVGGSEHIYMHYIGNIVYEGGKLSYIVTGEGRLVAVGTGSDHRFVAEYNLKDHLGNNRVTFLGSNLGGGSVDVVQTTSYYPFGLTLSQTNNNTATDYSKNKYLYNGKELQDDRFGSAFFGLLDYGARFYDPQIGRWHSVDPLAGSYASKSPYHFSGNNPILFIDKNGMDYTVSVNGKYRYTVPTDPPKKEEENKSENTPVKGFDAKKWFGKLVSSLFYEESDNNIPEEIKEELPFQGKTPRVVRSPDMISISVGGKFFYVCGAAVEAGLVYVKDDGFGVFITAKGGAGSDVSVGGNITVGWYNGDGQPSVESLRGLSFYIEKSGKIIDLGMSGDYSPDIGILGKPWTTFSVGYSKGSNIFKILPTGTTGPSFTFPYSFSSQK